MPYTFTTRITIDHTKCGAADSADFVLQFTGVYPWLGSVGNGAYSQSNGLDIIFTADPCGNTPLDFERVYWDASGLVEFHVRIPLLSHTADTVIWISAGRAGDSNHSNPHATWDAHYKVVAHFASAAGVLDVSDSTANGNNGTNHNVTPYNGIAGVGAARFNGAADGNTYIDYGNPASLQITGQITIEIWGSLSPFPGFWSPTILAKFGGGVGYALDRLWTDAGDPLSFWAPPYTTRVQEPTDAPFPFHAVAVCDGIDAILYVNGVSVGSFGTGGILDGSGNLLVGKSPNAREDWFGSADELRISNIGRSPSYVAACYANQSAPWTFYAVTAPASTTGPIPTDNLDHINLVVEAALNIPGDVGCVAFGAWHWMDGAGVQMAVIPYPPMTSVFGPSRLVNTLSALATAAAAAYDPTFATFAIPDASNPIFPAYSDGISLYGSGLTFGANPGAVLQLYDVYMEFVYADATVLRANPTISHLTPGGLNNEGLIVNLGPTAKIECWRTSGLADAPSMGLWGFELAAPTTNPLYCLTPSCNNPPGGQVYVPYSHSLTAAGGTPPYIYALSAGVLPPGLSMDAAGQITGVPVQSGTFNFAVRVTDAAGQISIIGCSITIVSSPHCLWIDLMVWRQLPQFTGLDQEIELPAGYEKALRYELAMMLAPQYGNTLQPTTLRLWREAVETIERYNLSNDGATEDPGGPKDVPPGSGVEIP